MVKKHYFILLAGIAVIFSFLLINSLRTISANGSLPAPNHQMWFTYYLDDSLYGNFRNEIKNNVNAYLIWDYYFGADLTNKLDGSFKEAVADGKKIIFGPDFNPSGIEIGPNVIRGLDIAKNYWSNIDSVYFDEPALDKAGMEKFINDFNREVKNRGLPVKPIAINFTESQFTNNTGYQASNLDYVGLEAYIDSSLQNDPNLVTTLNNKIDQLKAKIGNRQIFIVVQGYNRNGAWTNTESLKSIQAPPYLKAYNDPRVKWLLTFSYARPGGTKELNSCIRTEHQRIYGAITGTNQPQEKSCSENQPPTPKTISFPCQAAIQGYSGNYANDPDGWNFNMQSKSIGNKEKFDFIDLGGGKIAIKSVASGNYANANTDGNFNLQSKTIGQSETHTFISLGGKKFTVKSYIGLYANDAGGGNFFINSQSIGAKETLTLVPISGCMSNPDEIIPPPGGAPPNLKAVVQQVISDNPQLFQNRYEPNENPNGTWGFLEEVVKKLREKDTKFAFNGKRGDLNSPSHDAVSYYYGSGSAPDRNTSQVFQVYVIDITSWGKPDAMWTDVTDYEGCVLGSYLYPRTGAPQPPKPPKPETCSDDPKKGRPPFVPKPELTIPTEDLPGFGQLIAMIFTWSLNILGIVVFVMIFFAGFKLFTAAGNTANINEARGQITNAITGAIILLAAWIILYTINPDLVGDTFTLPGVGGSSTQQNP